jgi:hypothetical protein
MINDNTNFPAISNGFQTQLIHFYITDVASYEVLPSVNLKLKLPGTLQA